MADERAAYAAAPEVLRRDVTRPAKVLILDDHRLLAQMLVDRLAERGHQAFAIDVADRRLVERVFEIEPDLLLLDAVFADDEVAGLRILGAVRAEREDIDVVIITGVVERVRHAEFLAAGATAVISKADSFEMVVAQIEDLLNGRDPMGATRRHELLRLLHEHQQATEGAARLLSDLTAAEVTTLQGLVAGQSVQEMARLRTVAVSTVRSHVRAILRKLGVHSQIEAVAIATRSGLGPRTPT
jgi:two-component system nitrate/nitrite response regulator NarL